MLVSLTLCVYIYTNPAKHTIYKQNNAFEDDFQAIFASSIPEIIDLVGTRSKYGGEYKREHGKRYWQPI